MTRDKLETLISDDLRHLTELLDNTGREASHGFLGGEWGYGAAFENDVFMMHPYCWCERAECPWCRSCECDVDENTFEVTKECANCIDKLKEEPNFRHKATGFEVSWYKYIGRGMNTKGSVSRQRWRELISECEASIAKVKS